MLACRPLGLVGGVFLAFCIHVRGTPQDCPKKDDEKKLQGVWTLTKWMVDGETQSVPKDDMGRLEIQRRTFKLTQGNNVTDEGTITIDPSAKPKRIDITHVDPKFNAKIGLGIYEFKNDELWMAIARAGEEKRPTDFDARKGSGSYVMVFKAVREER